MRSKDQRGPGFRHSWSAKRSTLQDGGAESSSPKTAGGAGNDVVHGRPGPSVPPERSDQVTGSVEARVTRPPHPSPPRPGVRSKRPAAPDQPPDSRPQAGSSRRREDCNEDRGRRRVELTAPPAAPPAGSRRADCRPRTQPDANRAGRPPRRHPQTPFPGRPSHHPRHLQSHGASTQTCTRA